MKIIKITHDENAFTYTLHLDNGETLCLPSSDIDMIKTHALLDELRCAITNILDDEISGGYIDMDRHEYSREDFEEEVYCDLSDEIENGEYNVLSNDGEWIRERITDIADFYELRPEE